MTRLVLIVAPTMNWPSSVNRRYVAPASSRPPVMYSPVRLFGFGGAVVLAVANVAGRGHALVMGLISCPSSDRNGCGVCVRTRVHAPKENILGSGHEEQWGSDYEEH